MPIVIQDLRTCFGQSLCNHQLGHIDLVLQKIRYDTLRVPKEVELVTKGKISGHTLQLP